MKKNFTLTLKEKFAYGMGDFALMIGYGAIGFYLVFFLTDVAGLPAAWAGYIFLIARVWDAFIDYAMGFNSTWDYFCPYLDCSFPKSCPAICLLCFHFSFVQYSVYHCINPLQFHDA